MRYLKKVDRDSGELPELLPIVVASILATVAPAISSDVCSVIISTGRLGNVSAIISTGISVSTFFSFYKIRM